MATSVTDATLTVTITEVLTLNGKDQGGTTAKTFTVDECMRVVKTCPADAMTSLIQFIASPSLAGSMDLNTVKYLRVTNLDALNDCELGLFHASSSYAIHKLGAGQSHIIMTGVDNTFEIGNLATSSSATANVEDIVALHIHCYGGNAIDVELFAATA